MVTPEMTFLVTVHSPCTALRGTARARDKRLESMGGSFQGMLRALYQDRWVSGTGDAAGCKGLGSVMTQAPPVVPSLWAVQGRPLLLAEGSSLGVSEMLFNRSSLGRRKEKQSIHTLTGLSPSLDLAGWVAETTKAKVGLLLLGSYRSEKT